MSFLFSIGSKSKSRDVVMRILTWKFHTPVEMPTVRRVRPRGLHVPPTHPCRPGPLTRRQGREAGLLIVFALILAAGSLLADEQKTASTNAPATVPSTDLLLREVHYEGKLSDAQARFTVAIDAASLSKSE